jgi:hypothetical protein
LRELALHILDIAENSISALASQIEIFAGEDEHANRLKLMVADNGKGMDAATVARIVDPFVTSRTTRKVGLGIPLLKAAAEACNGYLKIESALGQGTRVDVEFDLNHIDRMPLGDLASTWITLLVGSPQVHWIFRYRVNDQEFYFDDDPIKKELSDIPLTEPSVLIYLKETLKEGILSVKNGTPVLN